MRALPSCNGAAAATNKVAGGSLTTACNDG
jgi:hypothetical protein